MAERKIPSGSFSTPIDRKVYRIQDRKYNLWWFVINSFPAEKHTGLELELLSLLRQRAYDAIQQNKSLVELLLSSLGCEINHSDNNDSSFVRFIHPTCKKTVDSCRVFTMISKNCRWIKDGRASGTIMFCDVLEWAFGWCDCGPQEEVNDHQV